MALTFFINIMGIVSTNSSLEEFLTKKRAKWYQLKDNDYRQLIKSWRSAFEDNLSSNYMIYRGFRGVRFLEEKLPFSGFLFNCPNYRYLPTTENPERGKYTFAYKIVNLSVLDRQYFNKQELIMCDIEFKYMCAFNHEAPDWFPEVYCER